QQPDALLEEEILVEQGADGAEIDDVAGEFVVQRFAGEDADLLLVAAAFDEELGLAADFAREADAARAHDAAVVVEQDVEADVLLGLLVFVLLKAALAAAVLVGVILEQAFARLIADGAVEGVIDQQVFHHLLLIGDRF